jgi:hypothetical protein
VAGCCECGEPSGSCATELVSYKRCSERRNYDQYISSRKSSVGTRLERRIEKQNDKERNKECKEKSKKRERK